jgi:hypothetical protein
MVEQTLIVLLEGRSLQLAMTMMHQLMNMVGLYLGSISNFMPRTIFDIAH